VLGRRPVAVEHDSVKPLLRQEDRGGQTGRPPAHDDHVRHVPAFLRRSSTRLCRPRNSNAPTPIRTLEKSGRLVLVHRLQPDMTATYSVVRMTTFRYAIDARYLPVLLPFLLRPKKDGVTLTDEGTLVATFGLFKVATPLANVTGAHITRNYRWWTAWGVRMSQADDGLTFGTNRDAGVCIHFAQRVPSALRRGGHSALTVTVADVSGLTEALGGDVEGLGSIPPSSAG
jgi:hypothetical protein